MAACFSYRIAYFLRRLNIANAVIPRIMPAMIDSHGNPGIGGNAKGVETELEMEVDVVEGGLTTVVVIMEVLTAVGELLVELAEVTAVVEVPTAEVLDVEEPAVVVIVTGGGVYVVDTVDAVTPPGGSR